MHAGRYNRLTTILVFGALRLAAAAPNMEAKETNKPDGFLKPRGGWVFVVTTNCEIRTPQTGLSIFVPVIGDAPEQFKSRYV